jgi:GT2 family glycosyltransferase
LGAKLPVSVILVNFNQGKFFPDAWRSITRQSLVPEKVYVIDDGSAGDDVELIEQLIVNNSVLNVEMISDKANLGISARLNQVLPFIETEWLLILAADDLLNTNALEILVSASDSETDVVWGDLEVMDEAGVSLGFSRPKDTWQGHVSRKYLSADFPFNDLLKFNNFVPGGMSLMRSRVVNAAGGWDSNITTEDFDLWLRISSTSKFKYIHESIGMYRVVSGSKSRRDNHKLRDQAIFLGKHSGQSREIDRGLAYLAAMRWAFTVFRTRQIPDYSLNEMSRVIGVSPFLAWLQMPRAVTTPLYWSVMARVKWLTK